MVLACESIFSRTNLDGRPRNLHTFSKVNPKYTKCTFPVGQARCSFHLPHTYYLQILLARGNGASTNVKPWMSCINLIEMYINCYLIATPTSHSEGSFQIITRISKADSATVYKLATSSIRVKSICQYQLKLTTYPHILERNTMVTAT